MKYIDYKERKEQGTFNFPIAYYRQTPYSPRYAMQYHWHPYCEIIRIGSGTFQLNLENNIQTYHAGDIIFISGGMLHGGTPQDCIYECIVFDLQILMKDNHACTKTIQDITSGKIAIHPLLSEKSKRIEPLVTELCHTMSRKKIGYEFMVQGFLYHLLGIIIEEGLYEETVISQISAERVDSIKKVLDYISDYYSNVVTLEDLAKVAGMNPRYFCRYFKKMTDRTPIDYLNYYRIECACEMLTTKDVSVRDVSISCGFNDESYFIKTFHKYKNVTPKQYVKNIFA